MWKESDSHTDGQLGAGGEKRGGGHTGYRGYGQNNNRKNSVKYETKHEMQQGKKVECKMPKKRMCGNIGQGQAVLLLLPLPLLLLLPMGQLNRGAARGCV